MNSFFQLDGEITGKGLFDSRPCCAKPSAAFSPVEHEQMAAVVELRKEAGLWLKELREKRGLSQRQMAEKVGANYYTFISQLELGRGRIPPDRYLVWAEVLGVDPKFFVRNLLRSYDPITYSILFGKSKPEK
jgi:DNA-binding XRE family transcriptional regulator